MVFSNHCLICPKHDNQFVTLHLAITPSDLTSGIAALTITSTCKIFAQDSFSGEFVVGLRYSRPEINQKTINNPNNRIIKTSRGEITSPHLLCSEQQMKEKHRGSLQITGGSGTPP